MRKYQSTINLLPLTRTIRHRLTHTQRHAHIHPPGLNCLISRLERKNRKGGNIFHAKRKRQAMSVVFLLYFIYRERSVIYAGHPIALWVIYFIILTVILVCVVS